MHTGQLVTRDDILGHTHEFAPTVDKLTVIGEGPLKVGPTGHYTDPQPGKAPDREFERCRWRAWLTQDAATLTAALLAGPAGLSWGTTLTWSWFKNESETTRAPVHYLRPCQVHRDQVDR